MCGNIYQQNCNKITQFLATLSFSLYYLNSLRSCALPDPQNKSSFPSGHLVIEAPFVMLLSKRSEKRRATRCVRSLSRISFRFYLRTIRRGLFFRCCLRPSRLNEAHSHNYGGNGEAFATVRLLQVPRLESTNAGLFSSQTGKEYRTCHPRS